MNAKTTDVIILATAKARPGKEADLERALRACAAPTRNQPGCVQFVLLRVAGDPSTLVGYERWASEEAHQRHLAGPHVQELMTKMTEIVAGPPSIVAYAAIDE